MKLKNSPRSKVFILSREQKLTHKEIAEQLNISVNTVEQHMRKALRILRTHLDYYTMFALLLSLSEAANRLLS